MPVLLRLLLAALGGVGLAGAFEPLGWTVLAPGGVAALVLSVRGLRLRRAWLPGLVQGTAFFFVLQVWMRAVGTDAWIGLSALEAAFFAPLGVVVALLVRHRLWPVTVALAWVAVETVRSSWPFSGMPWGRLSYAVADTFWASGLPWYGFTGVSLLLALTGTTLTWLVVERPARTTGAAAVGGVALLSLLPLLAGWDPRPHDRVVVAAVQGDVPGAGDDLVAVHREVTSNHVRATRQLAADVTTGRVQAPAFVVWPENSTAVDPFRDTDVNAGLTSAVRTVGVPVLVGGMVDGEEPGQVLNQGIVWDPVTGPGDRYTKLHPVPFGEYIPWRDVVFRGNLGKLRQIGRDMASGTRLTPLQVNGTAVADAICFDVAYDDGLHAQLRNGGELVTVQTSNAMFIRTHQIAQQYEITRLRAIETGRSVVVAATNGVTGIIGPDGQPLAEADPRTTSVLVHEVELSDRLTPAVRVGVWSGRLTVLVTVGLTAGLLLGRVRRRDAGMPYIHRASAHHPGSPA